MLYQDYCIQKLDATLKRAICLKYSFKWTNYLEDKPTEGRTRTNLNNKNGPGEITRHGRFLQLQTKYYTFAKKFGHFTNIETFKKKTYFKMTKKQENRRDNNHGRKIRQLPQNHP